MDVEPQLKTDTEFAEARKPIMRAFNDPPMAPEALFALNTLANIPSSCVSQPKVNSVRAGSSSGSHYPRQRPLKRNVSDSNGSLSDIHGNPR